MALSESELLSVCVGCVGKASTQKKCSVSAAAKMYELLCASANAKISMQLFAVMLQFC